MSFKNTNKIGRKGTARKSKIPKGYVLYELTNKEQGAGATGNIFILRGGANGAGVFTLKSFIEWGADDIQFLVRQAYQKYSAYGWDPAVDDWEIRTRYVINNDTAHNGFYKGDKAYTAQMQLADNDCNPENLSIADGEQVLYRTKGGTNMWPEFEFITDSVNQPSTSTFCTIETYFHAKMLIKPERIQDTNFGLIDSVKKIGSNIN